MLYLIATPIGNMEDVTLRALRILREVDAVYCEDTRHSGLLLSHYGIKKPLFSCHDHNEAQRAQEIAEKLRAGENLAYISDAGMPCISDPGNRLTETCVREGLPFTVIPGASASVTALALSGLPTDKFTFYGFLPRSGKERSGALTFICDSPYTTVIYESPNRVYATLCDLCGKAGSERRCALVREITKIYEECVNLPLGELCERYRDDAPKGECVLVLAGKPYEEVSGADIDARIRELLDRGMSAKDAAKQVAQETGASKNDVYRKAIEIIDN